MKSSIFTLSLAVTLVLVALATIVVIANSDSLAGSDESLHHFQLENGLQVTLRPVVGTKDVALVTLFQIGELHDPPGKSGLAHLVEHLYVTAATAETDARNYQGIMKTYPKGSNAQTGSDSTVIATVFSADKLKAELQDAAARMQTLNIKQADVDREIPRMLAEVANMFENFPPLVARNLSREALHPRPDNGRHGGHPDHIRQLRLEDAVARWREFYKPKNARLVIAGDFDVEETEALIRNLFGKIAAGNASPKTPTPNRIVATTIRKNIPHNSQAIVSIAMDCPTPDSELFPAFLAITSVLQKNSRQITRDPQQFPVIFAPLDDFGTIYVRAWANQPDDGKSETADEVVERLNQFIDNIDPAYVVKNGSYASRQFAFAFNTVPLSDRMLKANLYGTAFGIGRRESLNINGGDLKQKLESLDIDLIERCQKEYFGAEKRVVAIIE